MRDSAIPFVGIALLIAVPVSLVLESGVEERADFFVSRAVFDLDPHPLGPARPRAAPLYQLAHAYTSGPAATSGTASSGSGDGAWSTPRRSSTTGA